jgi:hypothetical protein
VPCATKQRKDKTQSKSSRNKNIKNETSQACEISHPINLLLIFAKIIRISGKHLGLPPNKFVKSVLLNYILLIF